MITKQVIEGCNPHRFEKFIQNQSVNFRIITGVILFLFAFSTYGFSQSNKELQKIVRDQDTLKLHQFIENGFDVNSTYRDLQRGECLLNRAIWFEKLELTKFIFKQPNLQIFRVDKDKRNTLHPLVRNGWFDFAKRLIESGVDLNTLGPKNSHILRLVLWENEGRMLQNESLNSSLEFIKYLYSKELDPQLSIDCCRKKTTILIFGVMYSDLATTEFLLSQHNYSINEVDSKERTALHWAVKLNKKDIVKFLIDNGANPNLKDKKGKLPLEYALKLENEEMISILKKASNTM